MTNPYSSPSVTSPASAVKLIADSRYAMPAVFVNCGTALVACLLMICYAYDNGSFGALWIAWFISPCVSVGLMFASFCAIPLVRRLFPDATLTFYSMAAIVAPILSAALVYLSVTLMDLHG